MTDAFIIGCDHAQQIVESVGGLPGLIRFVGRQIRYDLGELAFSDYVEPPESIAQSVGEVKDSYFDRTFRKAYEKLELSPTAKELMQICSLMDNTDIPMNLLKGGIGVVEWMTGMFGLRRRQTELPISNSNQTALPSTPLWQSFAPCLSFRATRIPTTCRCTR